MKIYLCSPHKFPALNEAIIQQLSQAGFLVFHAAKDTDQQMSASEIFKANLELIQKSDIVLAVYKDYGKDFAFEVGYAFALKKRIIGLDVNANSNDVMPVNAPTVMYKTLEDIILFIKSW
jgi:nucleoside 2-deoxyribosyltransferase